MICLFCRLNCAYNFILDRIKLFESENLDLEISYFLILLPPGVCLIRFSVVLYFHTQVSFAYSCPLALQTQAYSYLPLLLIYRLRFSKVRRFFATQLFFVGLVF